MLYNHPKIFDGPHQGNSPSLIYKEKPPSGSYGQIEKLILGHCRLALQLLQPPFSQVSFVTLQVHSHINVFRIGLSRCRTSQKKGLDQGCAHMET